MMTQKIMQFVFATGLLLGSISANAEQTNSARSGQILTVIVDCSQAPELREWCSNGRNELIAWYPRISNLLSSERLTPPDKIVLRIKRSDEGVAGTSGSTIAVHSGWVLKHPEDTGLLIHELTHVIQSYPNYNPGWVTEGIADYIRWAIYEEKPLAWFPVPQEPSGYTRGYRATAGFLLWLESGPSFGIVRKLNKAMRDQQYNDNLFEEFTGKPLPDLWKQYQETRKKAQQMDGA